MNLSLIYGMHGDKEIIHDSLNLIDRIIIPAHILAYSAPSTSVFLYSLKGTHYIIDPRTFIFADRNIMLKSNSENVKSSYIKLCEAYGNNDLNQVLTGDTDRISDSLDIKTLCKSITEFQLTVVSRESSESKARKYLEKYEENEFEDKPPQYIVPPYFPISNQNDSLYTLSLECAINVLNNNKNLKIAPILLCNISLLESNFSAQIINDYSKFDKVFLWVNDFNEYVANQTQIRAIGNFIKQLSKKNTSVEMYYSGYVGALMHYYGADGISHRILYSLSKNWTVVSPGGGMPERYYIPKIHQFRSLSQSDLILHQFPELICECGVCQTELQRNPDNIVRFSTRPDLLRKHFLEARRLEFSAIDSNNVAEQVDELRNSFNLYHEGISELRNPDAILTHANMRGLEFLNEWADAFSEIV